MTTAEELRDRFKQLPKEPREANQNFSIRMSRALSWLERAETMDAADFEGRFISAYGWFGR